MAEAALSFISERKAELWEKLQRYAQHLHRSRPVLLTRVLRSIVSAWPSILL